MGYRCEDCNKNFNSEDSLNQHNSMKHASEKNEKAKINWRRYFIFIVVILIIVFSVLSVRSYMSKPGDYDDFAKCLSSTGAVIYGNDYCQYTVKQLNYFGKSQKYLNYVKCIDNEALCDSKGVKITPTWEIKENMYSGVQTFEKLSAITGCEI